MKRYLMICVGIVSSIQSAPPRFVNNHTQRITDVLVHEKEDNEESYERIIDLLAMLDHYKKSHKTTTVVRTMQGLLHQT
jgi:hypothetical protein